MLHNFNMQIKFKVDFWFVLYDTTLNQGQSSSTSKVNACTTLWPSYESYAIDFCW